MKIKSVNPHDGSINQVYQTYNRQKVKNIVTKAQKAYLEWSRISYENRAKSLSKVAELLEKRETKLSEMMTNEMGKTISSGLAEIRKCAWVCKYYAQNGKRFLKDEEIETEAPKSYVTFNPLGIILAIMPWNFPFWQVFRFWAPAMIAGNATILKHASNVPGCALLIEKLINEAVLPKDIFQSVLIPAKNVDFLINNPYIKAVTMTGSSSAGKSVATQAGKVLKKTVLELGGNDPYLILEDADLEKAANLCYQSKMINAGQSCIAAKRFIVERKIASEFIDFFYQLMKNTIQGDPTNSETKLGPMARIDLRSNLHEQVRKSIVKGAKCILGGKIPKGKGAYYPATILTDVKAGMPAYEEELFGPVATIITVNNQKEAVRIANDSRFGLGAAVFSKDLEKAERIAKHDLKAGSCFVNSFVKSDPRLPFGGIKDSGYGRELSSYGIKEFVNIKTVYLE